MFRVFSAPEHAGIITQPSVLHSVGRVPYCRLFTKGILALDNVDCVRDERPSGRDGTIYGFN